MFGNFTPSVTRINRPSDETLCMRTCGCYRGQGYPGGSGFNTGVTVSGRVTGVNGASVPNLPMDSNVNGRSATGRTDTSGRYAVSGLRGSDISVAPRAPLGVTSTPPGYTFINLQRDAPNRNFSLRPTAPGGGQIMPF